VFDATVAGDGPGDPGATDCGMAPAQAVHDWIVPNRGTLSLVGPGEKVVELWVVATARTADRVVHWRQGPYDALGESLEVVVTLPDAAVQTDDSIGTVSTRVIAQDASGQVVARWSLPRLAFSVDERGSPTFAELPAASPSPAADDGESLVSADL
jgi:hypothetical protein